MKDRYGCTALHKAAAAGHLALVHLLVEKGAVANIRDCLNLTPLHRAACCGHSEVASYLLDHGAEINAAGWLNKTPLHLAVEKNHFLLMELLLGKGASLSLRTRWHETVQDLASGRLLPGGTPSTSQEKMTSCNPDLN